MGREKNKKRKKEKYITILFFIFIKFIITSNPIPSTRGQSMEPSVEKGVIIVGNTPRGSDMAKTRLNITKDCVIILFL